MSKTLLIDANSIFHAAQHAVKLSSGELETQAVFGAIKTARELRVVYPDFNQLWCHDTKATWRYNLHPEYKSNRHQNAKMTTARDALNEQRPYIKRALSSLGLKQVTVNEYEADDIIGHLSEKLAKSSGGEVGIITGDRDLLQLVKPNVWWRDIRDDARLVTMKNFFDYTGCKTPYGFLETKCLQGDSSDCISGVGGIGEKGAPEFIAEFGSVRAFWQMCDDRDFIPTKKPHVNLWKGVSPLTKEEWIKTYDGDPEDEKSLKEHMSKWVGQGRKIFNRNMRMMQLLKVAKPDPKEVRMITGKLDVDAFAELCEELSFGSILKNLDNFCNAFKE